MQLRGNNAMSRWQKVRRWQGGFTLIEVLVATVLLAVAMLGLISATAKNTQSMTTSDQSILVTMYTLDMANRMKANPVGVKESAYLKSPLKTANCYRPVGCTPEQMARMDLYEWQKNVSQHLPSGVSVVCLDETPEDGEPGATACSQSGRQYVVKIWWREDNADPYQRTVFAFEADK